jgi:hypothetical protein
LDEREGIEPPNLVRMTPSFLPLQQNLKSSSHASCLGFMPVAPPNTKPRARTWGGVVVPSEITKYFDGIDIRCLQISLPGHIQVRLHQPRDSGHRRGIGIVVAAGRAYHFSPAELVAALTALHGGDDRNTRWNSSVCSILCKFEGRQRCSVTVVVGLWWRPLACREGYGGLPL